ncbi:hypothetical protein ACFFX0_25920 [Citricoccus parietis]|uniref:Secreted protein n=1 Tax=Citricoccus parietis TaxID=592307 RepID=A0ABV5G658_9MICC
METASRSTTFTVVGSLIAAATLASIFSPSAPNVLARPWMVSWSDLWFRDGRLSRRVALMTRRLGLPFLPTLDCLQPSSSGMR